MIEAIDARIDSYERESREKAMREWKSRIEGRKATNFKQDGLRPSHGTQSQSSHIPRTPEYMGIAPIQKGGAIPRTIEDLTWKIHKKHRELDKTKGKNHTLLGLNIEKSRRLRPAKPLGQCLIDAARLSEAMAAFRDHQVLNTYLFKERLHLHPRRSLDQAYIWKLKTTHRRDRDQVVYRYSRPDFSSHRIQVLPDHKPEAKAWTKREDFWRERG
jgi:hypothetical protein